jgi:7-cyano-7-deazaguanine synthase
MSLTGLLLSGGMDSYALAFMEKPDVALTIDYGQKPAQAEIQASTLLANRLGIQHIVISINLSSLGSGDLSDNAPIALAPASDWWPYRNQALITIAAMRLISLNVNRLLIATVANDSYHTDGSLNFIQLMNNLLQLQEGHMQLLAPAINMSTVELVKRSGIPFSLLAWSHSCHKENIACGQCRGCIKHREVVDELGYAKT